MAERGVNAYRVYGNADHIVGEKPMKKLRVFLSSFLDYGVICPCCDQHAKHRRVSLGRRELVSLVKMYDYCRRHRSFGKYVWRVDFDAPSTQSGAFA